MVVSTLTLDFFSWSNCKIYYLGDAEAMKFKTVTIIGSSVGLIFLVVIGFLLRSVIKKTKTRIARKGHMKGVRKNKYMVSLLNVFYLTEKSLRSRLLF